LSDEGEEKVDDIVKLVYQYLNLLKNQKPAQWVFDEVANLGKISFTFKDKEKPISLVSSLSADLHVYSFEHMLAAQYYATKFDQQLIESLSGYLVPEKMKLTVVSKKFEGKTDKTEKWYGTEYSENQVAQEQIERLKSAGLNESFRLPPKNEYVPENLNLIQHDASRLTPQPRVIHSTPLTRLWYKEDTKFLLPKAVIKLELRNPLVYFDPVHVNMANMFEYLLGDALNEHLYSAELAGLKYNISTTNYGMTTSFSGFSDKINVLLETVYDKMASFRVDPQRFHIIKESVSGLILKLEKKFNFLQTDFLF
jgi:insulysin